LRAPLARVHIVVCIHAAETSKEIKVLGIWKAFLPQNPEGLYSV
jgi:hypothetical protein